MYILRYTQMNNFFLKKSNQRDKLLLCPEQGSGATGHICSLLTGAELLATVTCRGRGWAGGCRRLILPECTSHGHPAIKEKGVLGSSSGVGRKGSRDGMSTSGTGYVNISYIVAA